MKNIDGMVTDKKTDVLTKNIIVGRNSRTGYTGIEQIFAAITLVVGYMFCEWIVFSSNLGIFTTLYFLLMIGTLAFFTIKAKGKISAGSRLCLAALTPFSFYFTFFNNIQLQFCVFVFLFFGTAYWCYTVFFSVDKHSDLNMPFDMLQGMLVNPIARSVGWFSCIFSFDLKNDKTKRLKSILAGLALSTVLLMILIPLLRSADEMFKLATQWIVDLVDFDFDVFKIVVYIVLGTSIASLMFGIYYSGTDKKNDFRAWFSAESIPRGENIGILCTAVPVLIVYAVFFVTQLGYFIRAFDGLLPEGFTYSDYARRGFFELCVVSVINLLIIGFVAVRHKNTGNKSDRIIGLLPIIFSLISLLLAVISIAKMFLYMDTYGLTRLRVFTTWFMVLFTIFFILIIIKTLKRDFLIFKTAVCVFLIMFGGLLLCNVDRQIARYNINAFEAGKLKELDYRDFAVLSADAAPEVERLANSQDTETAGDANRVLISYIDNIVNENFNFSLNEALKIGQAKRSDVLLA